MNKFLSFALAASLSIICHATNVEWNRMKAVDAEVWDSGPLWMVWGYSENNYSVDPCMTITVQFYMGDYLIASPLMAGGSTIWVKQMSYGSIVSESSMAPSSDGYFYQTEQFVEKMHSDYSIEVPYNESVYLAFKTIAYDDQSNPYPVYGWVEVSVPGLEPKVLGSAWDLDGGAMIVGSGAIPEPTSGLLLILGAAALALRRRRSLRPGPISNPRFSRPRS